MGSGLVGQGFAIRMGRFLFQTPLDAWPGLGPGDKITNAVINIWLVSLSSQEWPKVCRGTAK